MARSLGLDGLTPVSKKQFFKLHRLADHRPHYFVKHLRFGKTISLESIEFYCKD